MSKVSRWWSSVVTYEKGVGRNIAVSLNRSRWWKVVATMMVAVAVFGVLSSDYFETADESVSEHGRQSCHGSHRCGGDVLRQHDWTGLKD